LSLVGYSFEADLLRAVIPPEVESIEADLINLGSTVRWPALRSFQHTDGLHPPPIDANDVKVLAGYPRLERLNVRCQGLKAAHIKALSEMPHLRELTLRFAEGNKVPSLNALNKAPALESLRIEGGLTDQHLLDVANIQGLRFLALGPVSGAARGLHTLAGLTQLEVLQIEHGDCAGEGPPASLVQLPMLEKLDMHLLEMPQAAARALKAACPPWVECKIFGIEEADENAGEGTA
jgi:hypothetical protein